MLFCFFFSVALSVFAEGQWREKESRDDASACQSSDVISQKHMETLRHICRTHLRCRNTSTLLRSQRQLLLGRQKVFANVGWTFCFFRFLFLFFFSGFRQCLKLGRFYNFLIFFFFLCKHCFPACAGPQHDRPSASVEEQVRLARLFFPPLTISQISRNMSRE